MTKKEIVIYVVLPFVAHISVNAYNMQKFSDLYGIPAITKGLIMTTAKDSIMVDPVFTMTRDTANASIALLQAQINSKADTGVFTPYNGNHASGTWNIDISGNAITVTNGVYSSSHYNDPPWIDSLTWGKIKNVPDFVTSSGLTTILSGYATSSALTSGLAGKLNTPLGTTAQYLRGDGSLATFPATGTVTSVALASTDFAFSGSPITTSGTLTANLATSSVVAGSYYGKYTINSKGIMTAASNPIDSVKTRSLNTSFKINTTKDVVVRYSVLTQITSALAGVNTGSVYLERSVDNSTWTQIDEGTILSSGIVSTVGNSQKISGVIPANYWLRLRTDATGANAGSAAFTYKIGVETTY